MTKIDTSNSLIHWAVPCKGNANDAEIRVHFQWTFTQTILWSFKATGELRHLIVSNQDGITPIGIVLDRLEEYPHELETDPETHRRILRWMRGHFESPPLTTA